MNCATIGVDWRDLTWWEYSALLFTNNVRNSEQTPQQDFTRLQRAMTAHTAH